MMDIKLLQWDSNFFGLKIGRVDVIEQDEVTSLLSKIQENIEKYDLLYLFCLQNIDLNNKSALLVDEKTIYTKQITPSSFDSNVSLYVNNVPNEDLYRLAFVSGEYSRYKTDKKFPKGSYQKLYSKWIEESVKGNLADVVLTHSESGKFNGMITAKIKDSFVDIGLVAVDTDSQSNGVGTKMMKSLETYLFQNTSVRTLKVATQWDNLKARRWYEKNGFEIESVTKIYHIWLNK